MFDYDSAAIAAILGTSLDAVFTIDAQGLIVDTNPAATRMFGWQREEFLGANISLIVPSPLKEKHDGFLRAFRPDRGVKHVLGSGQRLDGLRKDGSRFPVEVGISAFERDGQRYFTGFVRDMSERQHAEDRMRYLALHDAESGLLNYRGFAEQCAAAAGGERRMAVFRIEEFRRFSVAYGERWSIATVQEIAARLGTALAPHEIAGRVREDSFALWLGDDAGTRIETLAAVLREPYALDTTVFLLTVTFGLSAPGGDFASLLRTAQWACYRAGAAGRGGINAFAEGLQQSVVRELGIESRLREAVRDNLLTLVLQPKCRLADRRIVGAEALVRWSDPLLGAVPPAEFIPLAERLGLVGKITDWMLQRSLAEIAACPDPTISVAVNFSALDFYHPDLVVRLCDSLDKAAVPPDRLVVELTESAAVHDVPLVNGRLQALRALGVGISLDDFGTGHTALAYLRQFAVDSLKIDIAFVRDLPDSSPALGVTRTIVALARGLGLETIAEGVETEAQAATLRELGVDVGQGFLFGRPLPPAEFHRRVREQMESARL
ncbi:EAL domain-containing protein [Dechloromonas sp. XY25]|uniref:EAL domain-containing protein n=1 Tax=Dechloromonas hankyongensis TaxID=2908002 RepID=A0ABS9K118_9RHOO|nr:GGDEF domain-containing phosphodiesterase [Dechloromonas hankyongensis]MCG2576856.1 EAL domain-containing protein [Dechloromonas hankyongensis]